MHRWRYTLRQYVYPRLGAKAVEEVTTADVMAVLLPIWTRKHATAQQVRQRIGTVMKWAIAQGYRNDNPAAEAVTAALPKRGSGNMKRTSHHLVKPCCSYSSRFATVGRDRSETGCG